MRDLAPYIYPLIFGALVLLNYVIQRVAKQQKQQSPPDEEPDQDQEDLQRRAEEMERLREQLRQRKRPQLPRAEKKGAQPTPQIQPPAERARRIRPAAEEPAEVREARARRSTTPMVAEIGVQRRSGVRALLADRRSLRQAIIIMTVLGPCRAQQPPDVS